MNQANQLALRVTVLQSHRAPLPHPWIAECVSSVKTWAAQCGFNYRWVNDQLFDVLEPTMRERTAQQPVVASDLARLIWCERLLTEGNDVVIWCDADTLIPWPEHFRLTVTRDSCGVGREHWVQRADQQHTGDQSAIKSGNKTRTPKIYRKVHNAFMWFGGDNTFLPFYRESAAKLLHQHAGPWVSQFIGPKLLTALHNIVGLPVVESAGVISPPVVQDILHFNGEPGSALKAWAGAATQAPLALNLCASSVRDGYVSDAQMSAVCASLLGTHGMPGFDT